MFKMNLTWPEGGVVVTRTNVVAAIAVLWVLGFVRYVWWRVFSYQGIPKTIPWAGAATGGLVSRAKASIRSFLGLREMLLDGYREYSKKGRAFILPNIVNGHEVVVPVQYMGWILEQPEAVLSQYETNRQFMCGDYTTLDVLSNSWSRVDDRVRRELSHGVDDFVDAIVDEVQDSLRSLLGSDTETWHEIVLFDIMSEAVGRVVGRVLVGLPVCRNPGYVQSSTSFSKYILLPAMAIELMPAFLKPLVGPVVTFWDKLQFWRMRSYLEPMFRERVGRMDHGPASVGEKPRAGARVEPNDYIQWALRDAVKCGDNPSDPEGRIMKRLAVTTFAAVQSSAITITNAVMDIAAYPNTWAVQDELRAEVAGAQGVWTRASLAQLPKLDSVLTETLRLWVILTHGITKTVVAPDGVTIPTGEHIPYGAKVGIASYGPHFDEDVYGTKEASPFVFDPFRFTRPEVASAMKKKQSAPPGMGFVTTNPFYMGFSHGRSACPGRIFANSLLKIILSHILLMYDIAPIKERPANPWLNNTIGPPVNATIRVRRRKASDGPKYV